MEAEQVWLEFEEVISESVWRHTSVVTERFWHH